MKIILNLKVLLMVTLILFNSSVWASQVNNSLVSTLGVVNASSPQISTSSPYVAFVYMSVAIPGLPACGAGNNRYAIDLRTAGGEAMYATAMTARDTGKTVTVVGSGTCGAWIDTETAVIFYMNP